MTQKKELRPEDDGVTHIDVYSKGKTDLGKDLSHFAHKPFCHLEHGLFASVEGYWYWLTRQAEELRHAHGYAAKEMGRGLPIVKKWHPERFRELICQANDAKLARHPELKEALEESRLPLEHYYVQRYGGKPCVVQPKDSEWILAHFEQIRQKVNPFADMQHSESIQRALEASLKAQREEPSQIGLF
ncbi:hypothetical protein V0M98_32770 (plasmid) [Pseudomonas silesiensis]|uniref:hypothetical protein n=1 Tax=Pseudomonas silesiensis TaxID=1853130 RepID=UPI0030D2A833